MNDNGNRLPIIESLILSSPEPLPARKICDIIDDTSVGEIAEAIDLLNEKYLANDLSFRIRQIAGGYQVYITENYSQHVEELLTRRRNIRLTRASLEALAIIAYRQPVTRADIEMIRGVASDSVIHTLLERNLIALAGRAETIGRPLLYRTTDEFLKFFNLRALSDLPRMEEIEELLAERDSDSQPSLPLVHGDSGLPPVAAEKTSSPPTDKHPETIETDDSETTAGETADELIDTFDNITGNNRDILEEVESSEKHKT